MSRDFCVDHVEISRESVSLRLRQFLLGFVFHNLTGRLAAHGTTAYRIANDFCKGGLPRAEKARHPYADALVRLTLGVSDGLVHGSEMIANRFGDHILLQFLQDCCLISLVDLDDFLDPSINRLGEYLPNCL